MAEFCKIKSGGTIQNAPNPLRIVISNPSNEWYRYEGWLEKRCSEPPEYDHDTQYITDYWEQDGQFAVQHWEIHDIPVEDTMEE